VIGDHEPADSFDTAPADPEQVARRYRQYEGGTWEGLDAETRARRIAVVVLLLAWLRREGHLR
jgi:hypothetical protein